MNIVKLFWGKFALELIVIVGFLSLLLISWFYSSLDKEDSGEFWKSVLSGAFVDIFSLIISSILITYLVNRKREHDDKNNLYTIIKKPHKNFIDRLLLGYLYMVCTKKNSEYKIEINKGLSFDNIDSYFKEYIHEDYLAESIMIKEMKRERDKNGVIYESVVMNETTRSQLFYDYGKKAIDDIDDYIKSYQTILTTEYLSRLVSIRECLKENPFQIFIWSGDLFPSKITNVEQYTASHQEYINEVKSLIKYFADIDVQEHWYKRKQTSLNQLLLFSLVLMLFTYLLIKVGIYLVSI